MLLGLLAAKLLLLVQASSPSIAGVVRDGETGAPLADAVVALPDLERSVLSDSAGRYGFTGVPPGPQHLSVRRIGYSPRTLHALVPAQGSLRIDLSLDPVPLRLPHIVVRSRLPLRGLEDGDSTPIPDRSVSIAELRTDPLLAEPDGLLGLTGGEVSASLETPSGIHVRGGASDQTRYVLDGIPVFSPYHAAGLFTAWNPDALERLEISSASPTAGLGDALSGTVTATTRSPGTVVRVQGGFSTTHARMAVDGPIGGNGAGYLVSFRSGFPGLIAPDDEQSYLSGETQDLLVKSQVPVMRGNLQVLFYDSRNSIGTAVAVEPAAPDPRRNGFEWASRSFGAQWSGSMGRRLLRVRTWTASGDAEATWIGGVPLTLESEREDHGLLATLEWRESRSVTSSGVRLERSRTDYRARPLGDSSSSFDLKAQTPVGSIFLQHRRALGRATMGNLALSAASAAGGLHLDAQGLFRWQLSAPLVVSASYGRTHQFSQSLRNPESVVGNIFPPDLYVGAEAAGIPVARNQRGVIAADYRPVSALRLGTQVYLSRSDGLLLVAPSTGEPFATGGYTTGSATAPGFSFDAVVSGSRYGLLARYGWQRVRLEHADSGYTPVHGAGHRLELGAILFPSATSSIRIGFTGAAGRRATGVTGAFEWEACNLLDRGCEFGGSPQATGTLGGTRLPAYLRLDLGVRKHWHFDLAGKDMMLALYGTLTNLLGRTNVLTFATDPATGRRTAIDMRPRAPLVLGMDWRF
jgi:Carboxypeptidase regulatory-like domain/TonB-dependent Receptor Plug Domain